MRNRQTRSVRFMNHWDLFCEPNELIPWKGLKSTFSDIVNSFIILSCPDFKFRAALYIKLSNYMVLLNLVWCLKAPVIFHCNWMGEKQEEEEPGYSWEFFHLNSIEVRTSNGFLKTWRWLNDDWIFILREPK